MALKEYRVYVQGHDILGFDFIQDVIKVGKQGGEVDMEQVRMQFPHNAVFFLKTDKDFENTPTITYTVVTQMFTSEEDLDALSIDEFRNQMKLVGIKSRNRQDATTEYLTKFVPEDTTKEVEVKAQKQPRKNKLQDTVLSTEEIKQ